MLPVLTKTILRKFFAVALLLRKAVYSYFRCETLQRTGDTTMTAQETKQFKADLRTLPGSVMYDPWVHNTLDDLVFVAQVELDLIEENQDGADKADAPGIRRWLKKWRGKMK